MELKQKAQHYLDLYADKIYQANRKTINKIAKATGNVEKENSLKVLAQAAIWIAVHENPKLEGEDIYAIAYAMYRDWLKDEYTEEILRSRNRKNAPEEYVRGHQFYNPKDKPEKNIEDREKAKKIYPVMNWLIEKWGPQIAIWVLVQMDNGCSVREVARKLGFTEKDLSVKNTSSKLRNVYRTLDKVYKELHDAKDSFN